MTDPFDALRAPDGPIDPDPRFTTRLREQLRTTMEAPMPNTLSVQPYLTVDGAAAAIDFYVAAFGAVEEHRLVEADGRIGHAELRFGDSRVALADEYPDYDAIAPTTRGGTSTQFALEVTDADAVVDRAVALGATLLRPVADQFYGRRAGTIRDPWGHQWSIGSPLPGFNDAQYAANAEGIGLRLERPET
ncbi:MAG: VOC family protein [Ilumatobacteraceae bacterium]|nr:VOC family protein [Ilumatobacteraceae bacterium]